MDDLQMLPLKDDAPKALRVAVPPALGKAFMEQRLNPLAEYLTEQLGIQTILVSLESYGAIYTALRNHSVDAAAIPSLAYVKSRHTLPIVALATAAGSGAPTYLGYLLVRKDSPYHALEDINRRTVAWVSEDSSSGYLYQRDLIRFRGYDPDTFFAKEIFAGDHLSAIETLVQKKADAAAASSIFVDSSSGAMLPQAEGLRVIAKTRRIPLDCFVVHNTMSRRLAQRMRAALFDMDNHLEYSARLVRSWGVGGFTRVDMGAYEATDEILRIEEAYRRRPHQKQK